MVNYNDVLKFIEDQGIELFPYQKVILLALCEDLEVEVPRATGRSFIVKLLSDYLGNKGVIQALDKNSAEPDIIFSYRPAIRAGIVRQDFVDEWSKESS